MVFNSFETSSRPWPHPYFDYIASGIYGFTGWPAEKVVMTATDILKTRSAHEVDYARWKENRTDLLQPFQKIDLPGLCGTTSHSMFTIGDCVERKMGEH
jgi:hypothetical protein